MFTSLFRIFLANQVDRVYKPPNAVVVIFQNIIELDRWFYLLWVYMFWNLKPWHILCLKVKLCRYLKSFNLIRFGNNMIHQPMHYIFIFCHKNPIPSYLWMLVNQNVNSQWPNPCRPHNPQPIPKITQI